MLYVGVVWCGFAQRRAPTQEDRNPDRALGSGEEAHRGKEHVFFYYLSKPEAPKTQTLFPYVVRFRSYPCRFFQTAAPDQPDLVKDFVAAMAAARFGV